MVRVISQGFQPQRLKKNRITAVHLRERVNHCGAVGYTDVVPGVSKRSQSNKAKSVRQSVTIPGPLAAEVKRFARERQLTVSRALVSLAERGVRAEQDEKDNLKASYERFLQEQEPSKKDAAGKDLIRAIFGEDALATDPVL